MAEKVSPKQKSDKSSSAERQRVWSDDEMAAMKERASEVKAARSGKTKPDGEADVLAKIAEMIPEERVIAEQIHKLIKENVPELTPKTWYGMQAYANTEGKVVVFFQNAGKFKVRYNTLGFNDSAQLDDGNFWPTAYAIKAFGPEEKQKVLELINKSIGR